MVGGIVTDRGGDQGVVRATQLDGVTVHGRWIKRLAEGGRHRRAGGDARRIRRRRLAGDGGWRGIRRSGREGPGDVRGQGVARQVFDARVGAAADDGGGVGGRAGQGRAGRQGGGAAGRVITDGGRDERIVGATQLDGVRVHGRRVEGFAERRGYGGARRDAGGVGRGGLPRHRRRGGVGTKAGDEGDIYPVVAGLVTLVGEGAGAIDVDAIAAVYPVLQCVERSSIYARRSET